MEERPITQDAAASAGPNLATAMFASSQGAVFGPTPPQWIVGLLLIAGLMGVLAYDVERGVGAVHALLLACFSLAIVWRLLLAATARRPAAPSFLPEAALPAYTLIVPLYREAAMVEGLVAALEQLDYPRDRLQTILALEADDAETLEAVQRAAPPCFVETVIAHAEGPRTKPRALNSALAHARGEIVAIYDAEDRPGTAQLREAAARFAAAPEDLGCFQAPLRIGNGAGFLRAQFALEYAVQFEIVLPALARLGFPLPLGGTSNHFRIAALRAIGGWDAYNVTEDADAGFRLVASGYRLGVLSTPTWEDAPESFDDWLPQRTRWVKGYMQTWGVHMRRPLARGWKSFCALQLTLGLAILAAWVHGPMAALIAAWTLLAACGAGSPPMAWPDAVLLAGGWAATVLVMMAAARRAGIRVRLRDGLLALAYWPLHSLAAGHAFVQLFVKPFHWDKTVHRPWQEPGALDGAADAGVRPAE